MARTHSRSLDAGGLNWDSLPMKLFAGGNAKFWNPADIDFSRDRADWESLTDLERDFAARVCAQFIAGEEAVTQDIQPFMAAMLTGRASCSASKVEPKRCAIKRADTLSPSANCLRSAPALKNFSPLPVMTKART